MTVGFEKESQEEVCTMDRVLPTPHAMPDT